jgi:AraC-like DNA-binding protein
MCSPTSKCERCISSLPGHIHSAAAGGAVPARPNWCWRSPGFAGNRRAGATGRHLGTSARTLSRLFSIETQLSFKSWCQRARIAASIEKLSDGSEDVGQADGGRSRLYQSLGILPRV